MKVECNYIIMLRMLQHNGKLYFLNNEESENMMISDIDGDLNENDDPITVADYFREWDDLDLGITSGSSDDLIHQIAEDLFNKAKEDDVIFSGGATEIVEYLKDRQDRILEEIELTVLACCG